MKRYIAVFVILTLIQSFNWIQAQTVDEVIGKYIEALGGKEKINSIKSLYLEGVTVMQNGNELTMKVYRVQDKLFRREVEFGGFGSQTSIITDKQGWRSNPRNGGVFESIPEDRVKAQQSELDIAGPLVDYVAKSNTVELLGKENIDGAEVYKIKVITKSGNEVVYFIDSKTGYIVRETRKGNIGGFGGGGRTPNQNPADGMININYSNYQKTSDGYIFPFTVSIGGQGAALNYEKIEVNKPVDEKLYKPN